jgi:hypothetical protein
MSSVSRSSIRKGLSPTPFQQTPNIIDVTYTPEAFSASALSQRGRTEEVLPL